MVTAATGIAAQPTECNSIATRAGGLARQGQKSQAKEVGVHIAQPLLRAALQVACQPGARLRVVQCVKQGQERLGSVHWELERGAACSFPQSFGIGGDQASPGGQDFENGEPKPLNPAGNDDRDSLLIGQRQVQIRQRCRK